MSNPIKRPAIPATTGVTDWESLRRFLEPVKTLLEIHEGWRGRPNVDRFVPEGEIGGLTARVSAVEAATATDGDPPDPPTNMEAAAGTWGNTISWVNPEDADLYYVEIWVNTDPSVSEAKLAGWVTVVDQQGEAADFFHLPKDIFDDHYYWIRAVDWSGNYSTWVPTDGMGGALVEGKETVSELIDTAMEILKGSVGSYPAYSASTTYNGGERVVYAGKTYQCTDDGTVGIAPDNEDPPGINYWVRVGIVIEGEIDGVNTVGVDGALVVDQSITARTIATGQLVVTGDPEAPGKVTISGNAIHIADLNAEVTDEIDAAFAAGQILNAPGFEVGFTGWDVFGSGWAITEDAGNVFSGSKAAQHSGTAGTGYIQNKEFAVDAGERYLLQMRCRAQTGADGLCRLRIKFMDADGVALAGGYINAEEGLPGADWEWWRGVVTAPAGAKKACVQVTREGPPTTGNFYVDNVMAALIPKDVDIDALETTNGPAQAGADITADHAGNLVDNPGFEAGETGWSFGGAWQLNTVHAYAGTYCAQCGVGYSPNLNAVKFPTEAGERYLLQCRVKKGPGAVDGTWVCRITWLDNAGSVVSHSTGDILTGSCGDLPESYGWGRVICTAPAGAVAGQVQMWRYNDPTFGVIYVDNVACVQVTKDSDIDARETTNGPTEANADNTSNQFDQTLSNIDDWSKRAGDGLNTSGRITQAVFGDLMPDTDVPADGPGLCMNGTRIGYYDGVNGIDGWSVYIKNDGTFYFGDGSDNYFAYTMGELVFSTNQSGAFHILSGGDLSFYTADGSPSLIKWIGQTDDVYMGMDWDYDRLCIFPTTSKTSGFYLGLNTSGSFRLFDDIIFNASGRAGMYVSDTGYNAEVSIESEKLYIMDQYDPILIETGDYVTIDAPYVQIKDTAPYIDLYETDNSRHWYLVADGNEFQVRPTSTSNSYFRFQTDGDLLIQGKLTEGSGCIDLAPEDDIWEMAESMKESFAAHDNSKLHAKLKHWKVNPENGEVFTGRRPSDLVQILTDCVLDLRNEINSLKPIKQ